MDKLLEEINMLREKANKYDNMKERYDDYAKKLKEAQLIITNVLNDVNPYLNMKSRQKKTGEPIKIILEELYDLLSHGTEITSELIQTSYNTDDKRAIYILSKLRNHVSVKSRKEGKKIFLYMQKDI